MQISRAHRTIKKPFIINYNNLICYSYTEANKPEIIFDKFLYSIPGTCILTVSLKR